MNTFNAYILEANCDGMWVPVNVIINDPRKLMGDVADLGRVRRLRTLKQFMMARRALHGYMSPRDVYQYKLVFDDGHIIAETDGETGTSYNVHAKACEDAPPDSEEP